MSVILTQYNINYIDILPSPGFKFIGGLYKMFYEARAERGLLTNQEDTIPDPSDSIGPSKMYILEKHILGNQILTLGFCDFL